MWKLKDLGSSLENAFGAYSETEIMVREATCEEPWGPTNQQMENLCDLCDREPEYSELMNMLWFRIIHEPQKSWRRVYKGLLILDFLIKNGPIRIIHDVIENIHYLEEIKLYKYIDTADGVDKTINITHRSAQIRELVEDHDRLRKERKSMRQLRQRMQNDSNCFSKSNDKSLALKTRSFINDVIEKVTNNNPSSNKKSFYESSKRVFKSSYSSYRRKYVSDKNIYHDESDDNNNSNNDVSRVVEIKKNNTTNTNNDNNDDDEFGEFVGTTTTSTKQLQTIQKNNDDLLMEIFGDQISSNIPTISDPNGKPTIITTEIDTIDSLFSNININKTPNNHQPNNLASFTGHHNNQSFIVADDKLNFFTTPPQQNNLQINHTSNTGANFNTLPNPFTVPETFAITPTPTSYISCDSMVSSQRQSSNEFDTTKKSSSKLDLDSLINKNMMF